MDAPVLLAAAIIGVVVAWQWPSAAARVSESPRLSGVPSSLRSTPMRLASTFLVVALALTATSIAIAGAKEPADKAAVASASGTPAPTRDATVELTPTSVPTDPAEPQSTPAPKLGLAPTGPMQNGHVVAITDGDTIRVAIGGTVYPVRYIGMNTPEIHGTVEWMGPEASDANAKLVANADVVLEKDVSETDRYGRLLRYVWLHNASGWLLVNLELVREGFAQVATYPPDVKYTDDLFVPAQEKAQAEGIGCGGRHRHPSRPPRPQAGRDAIRPIPRCASRRHRPISTAATSHSGGSRSCRPTRTTSTRTVTALAARAASLAPIGAMARPESVCSPTGSIRELLLRAPHEYRGRERDARWLLR